MAAEPSILESAKPYIERLLLTPQGIGILAMLAGVVLRMTHTPAQAVVTAGDTTVDIAGFNATFNKWQVIPPSNGLDQVLFKIPLPAVQNYISTLEQGFAGGPIMGIAGMLGWHIQGNNAQDVQGNIAVMLSDVLIICGAGAFLGSSVSQILSHMPVPTP